MATIPGVRERRRPLAALLAAEAISTTGSQMTLLALPWFVLVTTGSPARMGVVVAADLVPMVVLALPGGALVGRLGARRTMLACDLARAPLIGLVPLLHALGLLSFPVLVGLVVCTACSGPLTGPPRKRCCPSWSATTAAAHPGQRAVPGGDAP
jgi:MFS family permease